MKKYLFAIAATVLVAACNPTEVELIEPTTPDTETPGDNPGGNSGSKPSEANDFNNNHYWLLFKEGKFELLNTETNGRGQFTVDEAERLLRAPNTVWVIPSGAPYGFTPKTGLSFNRDLLRR